MKQASSAIGLLLLSLAFGCAPASPAQSPLEALPLVFPEGRTQTTGEVLQASKWTVLVFIAHECACLDAHDSRLRELASTFGPKGVRFVAIDSEVGATQAREGSQAAKRGYPFPIVIDEKARLANELGAEYATFTVVLDSKGQVLYRGGIDSDKQTLHEDAIPYVREVLTDVTAGKPPRRSEGKALGCVLRKW